MKTRTQTKLPIIFPLGRKYFFFKRNSAGLISGYRLYYMSKQVTDVVTVKDSSQEIVYQLKNLGINITY